MVIKQNLKFGKTWQVWYFITPRFWKKTFDTVEWDFIFKALKHYNFGKQFIGWTKLLYSKPLTILKNNGWLSNKITLNRGICQECPLSALLFILLVEVPSDKLKTSNIEGIMYIDAKKELKLCQHADDMAGFLRDDYQLAKVIDIVSDISKLAQHR